MNQIISTYLKLLKNPLSNIPSLLFLSVAVFGIVTFITSFVTDILYIPFMLIAIISSLIAMWYIGLLGTLKENLEKLENNIDSLKSNNDHLRNELNSLQELRQNLEKYAQESKSDFNEILDVVNGSFERLEKITMENERTLLYRIAQDLEFMDKKSGMNRAEFKRFINRVPQHLQGSLLDLHKKSFEEIAGEDKRVDYKEVEHLIKSMIA